MNSIVEEMNSFLEHRGMPGRSGRYPHGSGEDPHQHCGDFLGRIDRLKKEGWTETPENIKKEFNMTTTDYRAKKKIASDARRHLNVERAKSLRDDGLNTTEIGRKMGVNESTVRSWLNANSEDRMNAARNAANYIKEQVDKKGVIDIGVGVERELGISREKMKQAIEMLKDEGYVEAGGRVPQATNPGKMTTVKVIGPPGTPKSAPYDYENIHSLTDYVSKDGGETFKPKFTYPTSLDSKRMMVRYAEDGGVDKDGVIELRRGVDDLSLSGSKYSQVRILVDGTHYLKGMAVYSDNMPDGVDVIFNTNKTKDVPAIGPKDHTVLKPIKNDPENPFGSAIKDANKGGQYWYKDKDGTEKLGLINKRSDEGDWTEWKDKLPSQFLSKQSLTLAKRQLNMALDDKQAEFDSIMSINNPTVKKYYLNKFAESCDYDSVHLQAAALPRQKYHVIIPVNTLKDTEVYAPGYKEGEKLALVRYPHGGTFEIPILTVTHKNPIANDIIGKTSIDAIGITKKNADRLSGADFDGDTVMCIPTHDKAGRVKISSIDPNTNKYFKELSEFDPKMSYGSTSKIDEKGKTHYYREGKEFTPMTKHSTQIQMGIASNLITDMTLRGASPEELARAVKHSMVVIDAEKHKLDYKQSEIDNGIASLKRNYQDGGGASTLLSRSKGQADVLKRQGSPKINVKGKPWYDPKKPEGSLVYTIADDVEYTKTKVNKKTGEVITETRYRTDKSTKMAETDDARTLISKDNTRMEGVYADFANSMKAMGNRARMEYINSGKIAYDASAKRVYKKEVDSLMDKLNTSLLNAPKERQANIRAAAEVSAKKRANPDMTPEEIKKANQKALEKYRDSVGSVSRRERNIVITDREWEAIQAGAISETHLIKILNNSDPDVLRQKATPRASNAVTTSQISRIKAYSSSGYSLSEIAKKVGLSTSTVSKYLKGEN